VWEAAIMQWQGLELFGDKERIKSDLSCGFKKSGISVSLLHELSALFWGGFQIVSM
jgi:hypothetical protein